VHQQRQKDESENLYRWTNGGTNGTVQIPGQFDIGSDTARRTFELRLRSQKKAFMDKKRLFTSKMNLELKKRITRCLIWSVALYAAETWTLTKVDVQQLEAFEMWIWQRMDLPSCRQNLE